MFKIEFNYQGRRIAKKVWDNVAGTNDSIVNLKYLYDGWNLIAELNGNFGNALGARIRGDWMPVGVCREPGESIFRRMISMGM